MPAPEDKQITLQAAAATLAITPSRLRRWADEGRIPSVRTAGGHRRFSLAAVRRLAAENGVRPTVRPDRAAGVPDPAARGVPPRPRPPARGGGGRGDLPRRAGRLVLPPRPRRRRSGTGSATLRASCESGVYAGALQATANLMQRAHIHAASLLERHAFLERFGQVCARTLVRTGAEREEIAGTRRLFAALQQGLLETARLRDLSCRAARRSPGMLTAALATAAALLTSVQDVFPRGDAHSELRRVHPVTLAPVGRAGPARRAPAGRLGAPRVPARARRELARARADRRRARLARGADRAPDGVLAALLAARGPRRRARHDRRRRARRSRCWTRAAGACCATR